MTDQANTAARSSKQWTAPVQASSRWVPRAFWIGLIVISGVSAIGWLWTQSRGEVEVGRALPVVAQIPDFSLIERDGRTVTRADLLGRVWVADFIFTACTGPCPTLTLRMRSLQSSLGDAERDVRLVSFTLDPETDTPAVLGRYAKRFQADPQRWWFLTGDSRERMHEFVKKGFLQAVSPATMGQPLIHSTRFVLVGRKGYIRAWYDGLDPKSKPLILRDLQSLLSEPAG